MIRALSVADIRRAFEALSEALRGGPRGEVVIVGGAALVLLFGARESTKDVDAVFVTPQASVIRGAAERVAESLGLPSDWLNDSAKGYVVALSAGEVLYDSPWLVVRAASIPQLLAMKLMAWRDAVDRADARLLLEQMAGSPQQIWTTVRPFVSPDKLDKASYAFDDLWESTYGSS